jgi:hypothetical protein
VACFIKLMVGQTSLWLIELKKLKGSKILVLQITKHSFPSNAPLLTSQNPGTSVRQVRGGRRSWEQCTASTCMVTVVGCQFLAFLRGLSDCHP